MFRLMRVFMIMRMFMIMLMCMSFSWSGTNVDYYSGGWLSRATGRIRARCGCTTHGMLGWISVGGSVSLCARARVGLRAICMGGVGNGLRIHLCIGENIFAFIYAPEKSAHKSDRFAEIWIPRKFEMPISRRRGRKSRNPE